MYFEMKDTVFKKQSKIVSHICDTDALERLLKDKLGNTMTMDSIKKPKILITAVNKSTTKLPLVFFSNCSCPEDSNMKFIEHELVWKVARCASAAPIFFSEHNNYVDGGVKANNPTSYALTEIQDYLCKTHGRNYKIACVVSLGCGEYPEEPLGNTDIADLGVTKVHHIFHRVSSLWTLFKHALNVSEETVRMTRIICEQQDIAFFRFSPLIGKDVGTLEKDNCKLCDIIIKTKELFTDPELAGQVEHMMKELSL